MCIATFFKERHYGRFPLGSVLKQSLFRLHSDMEYYLLIPPLNSTPVGAIFPPALPLHLPSSLYVSHPVVTPSPALPPVSQHSVKLLL